MTLARTFTLLILAGCAAKAPAEQENSPASVAEPATASPRPAPRPGFVGETEPPTEETCAALDPIEGCHWTLLSTPYCDGPAPPPQMTWPHCSCEPCYDDSHCSAGHICDTLSPEGDCPTLVRVCLDPRTSCTSTAGCPATEQCFAVGEASACRVPVSYPAKP